MSTKNPTLDSYAQPQIDVTRFEPAHNDVSPEFYEMLYSECDRVGNALISNLPVTPTENGYVIRFTRASFTEYENAIAAAPDVVLQAFVSTCHMTERIVREHLGIDYIYQYASEDAEIRGSEAIQSFIVNGCQEFLQRDLPLETVLFLYFRAQERNRVQYARGSFYKDVHRVVKKAGFAVVKDESLPGRPNFVVNAAQPVEYNSNTVAGKALKAKPNDVPKRARQAADRCGDLAAECPTANQVLVFKITGDPFPNDRVREKQRDRILSQNPDAVDAVFFEDELEDFIEYCDENITVFGKQDSPGSRQETDPSLDAWNN